MINKLIAFLLAILVSSIAFADVNEEKEKPRTKVVCKEVVKNGRTTKECKTIKVHKKLDGKKVPPEKKNDR